MLQYTVVYIYICTKRLCPAGKPFVETAVCGGSSRFTVVRACLRILLGSGHQKEQRGAPDFLSERRTQYRQLIIIAWAAKEKRKAIPQLLCCLLSPYTMSCIHSAGSPVRVVTFFYATLLPHTIFSAQQTLPPRSALITAANVP